MKVLVLNGSPHKKGVIARALQEVMDALHEENIDTEYLDIALEPVTGCKACEMCHKSGTGKCIFGSDQVNVAIRMMEECDGLIVGSPVHFGGAAGDITSFLDRMFYAPYQFTKCDHPFAYKPGAAIVSCRRAGSTSALEQLNKYFMLNNMPLVPSSYWNMIHGNTAKEAEQDLEGLMVMRTLGKNMAWLLKSIEAGKKAGLTQPECDACARTNFIR